jgi:hypothetical protein
MKIITVNIFLTLLLISESAFALTGREVMEKNNALKKADSSIQKNVLLIIKGDKQEKKEMDGIMKKYMGNTRKHISFSFPTKLEFLVWDEPGTDSQQWVKLSSGRVRKVASSDKGNPWVNSHFYNEDISENDINDFTYKLIGEENINNVACYQVESIKSKGTAVYSKTIAYISKNDFVMQRVDFFEGGIHTKTLTMNNIESISGIFTPRKLVMERTDGKGKSILYIQSIKYDVPVPEENLKRESF